MELWTAAEGLSRDFRGRLAVASVGGRLTNGTGRGTEEGEAEFAVQREDLREDEKLDERRAI